MIEYVNLPPSTFENEYVYTAPSPIHGVGIFAKRQIKKGTLIQMYQGVEMTWNEFKSLYVSYKSNPYYTYPMRRTWKILSAKEPPYLTSNISNYINSILNTYNVVLKKKGLYALVDIMEGEELSLNYPKDYRERIGENK